MWLLVSHLTSLFSYKRKIMVIFPIDFAKLLFSSDEKLLNGQVRKRDGSSPTCYSPRLPILNKKMISSHALTYSGQNMAAITGPFLSLLEKRQSNPISFCPPCHSHSPWPFFIQHINLVLAPGSWHCSFLVWNVLFLLHAGLSSNVTSSEKSSLTTLSDILFFFYPHMLYFIFLHNIY